MDTTAVLDLWIHESGRDSSLGSDNGVDTAIEQMSHTDYCPAQRKIRDDDVWPLAQAFHRLINTQNATGDIDHQPVFIIFTE